MTRFPVFHPPCLFVFSVVFFIFIFIYLFFLGGGICLVFSTFLFLIKMYLEFIINAVRYPYHLSLCYYSITYPTYVIYFSNFKSQRF